MDGAIQRDPNYHSIKGKALSTSSKRNGYKGTLLVAKLKVCQKESNTLTYGFPDPAVH